MVRKALKNIPKPDEEKLRALYSPPSEIAESSPTDRQQRTQNYISTRSLNYKPTSNQGYNATSTQDYASTSQHVYAEATGLPEKRTTGHAPSEAHTQAYQPAPPQETVPQGLAATGTRERETGPHRHLHPLADLYRRQTYHLRPDQIEWIRAEAFHTRRKISEVLRAIIDQHYQTERKP